MRKTVVVTDHGCVFRTGYDTETLRGKTMDCRVCGRLLIFPEEATYRLCTRARDFHAYLHETDPQWPADGAGTGYVAY